MTRANDRFKLINGEVYGMVLSGEEYYNQLARRVPLYQNPDLQFEYDFVEVMVSCHCGAQYRVLVNSGSGFTSMDEMKDLAPQIMCRNCYDYCYRAVAIHQHSCGIFNLTITRFMGRRAMPEPPWSQGRG